MNNWIHDFNNNISGTIEDAKINSSCSVVPDEAHNLIIIGNDIKLTKEDDIENAIYIGTGHNHKKIYIKNDDCTYVDIMKKIEDLEETLNMLMYAPPGIGIGGPCHEKARESFETTCNNIQK